MKRERQTRIAWPIVALVIIWTGLRHLVSGKINGKVLMSNMRPIEGWYVYVLGLVTLIGGLYFLVTLIRRR